MLEFRGGVVLTSKYQPFDGISTLHMQADGAHSLTMTDNGFWLLAGIVYDNGKPVRLADLKMALELARNDRFSAPAKT